MRYRISQLRVKPGNSVEKALKREIARRLRKTRNEKVCIRDIEKIRESIDARKKPDVKLVYTVDFECDEEIPFEKAIEKEYVRPRPSKIPAERPVVAGFGPCGIFAALILAEAGLSPIVIERGKSVDERVADVEAFWASGGILPPDPESNVQFGEGGAGTFSDGKLTTGIKDVRIKKVLKEFVAAGANPEILYKQKPHIGTDRLRKIVKNLRYRIEELGGEIRFETRLEGLEILRGRLCGIETTKGRIFTDSLILAIGHSARDTFEMLREKGLAMEQKPFSIGMRIEHPQAMINEAQYGDASLAEILGPADYKLNYRCGEGSSENIRGRGVYTFCMCPGGTVVNASTEGETSVTNGMSNSRRDGSYANSALLVDVRPSDFGGNDPLAGMEFQKKYEKLAWENRTENGMAVSEYGKFSTDGRDPVRRSLPIFASRAILEAMPHFARRLKGFDRGDAVITAVETRSSSPVRILRDENMQAPGFAGVIPAGEGPGYAGGIMSAAVDGIKAAEQIIRLK